MYGNVHGKTPDSFNPRSAENNLKDTSIWLNGEFSIERRRVSDGSARKAQMWVWQQNKNGSRTLNKRACAKHRLWFLKYSSYTWLTRKIDTKTRKRNRCPDKTRCLNEKLFRKTPTKKSEVDKRHVAYMAKPKLNPDGVSTPHMTLYIFGWHSNKVKPGHISF